MFLNHSLENPAKSSKLFPSSAAGLGSSSVVLLSCCKTSDRITIHRYYHSFHKNSGRVPRGGWSFIPGREKLGQQAQQTAARQAVFYSPAVRGGRLGASVVSFSALDVPLIPAHVSWVSIVTAPAPEACPVPGRSQRQAAPTADAFTYPVSQSVGEKGPLCAPRKALTPSVPAMVTLCTTSPRSRRVCRDN